jgi:hypothetical protein
VTRKRGNPNWERPVQPRPGLATEFEQQVHRLGLTMQTCADSGPLRYWCERNCNRCYVPEWLLRAWRIDVDPSLSDAPPNRTWLARGAARRSIAWAFPGPDSCLCSPFISPAGSGWLGCDRHGGSRRLGYAMGKPPRNLRCRELDVVNTRCRRRIVRGWTWELVEWIDDIPRWAVREVGILSEPS